MFSVDLVKGHIPNIRQDGPIFWSINHSCFKNEFELVPFVYFKSLPNYLITYRVQWLKTVSRDEMLKCSNLTFDTNSVILGKLLNL